MLLDGFKYIYKENKKIKLRMNIRSRIIIILIWTQIIKIGVSFVSVHMFVQICNW